MFLDFFGQLMPGKTWDFQQKKQLMPQFFGDFEDHKDSNMGGSYYTSGMFFRAIFQGIYRDIPPFWGTSQDPPKKTKTSHQIP